MLYRASTSHSVLWAQEAYDGSPPPGAAVLASALTPAPSSWSAQQGHEARVLDGLAVGAVGLDCSGARRPSSSFAAAWLPVSGAPPARLEVWGSAWDRFVREDEFQALLDTLGSYKGKTSLAQVNLTSIKVELV